MNPVRDEVTEKLDMQELPVVKGWFRLTFGRTLQREAGNVTPSNFNSLLNGSCPEWTNYNLIVKSDRLRNDREGRDYSGVVSRCSPRALANRAPFCGPGL